MARILVVDDSSLGRLMIREVLREAGHEVVEAEDGIEGVDRYISRRPDAVLLDLVMPRMDGLAALAIIRRIDPTAQVIMLTAKAEKETALTASRTGAVDFVVKPFDGSRLLQAIDRALRSRPSMEP